MNRKTQISGRFYEVADGIWYKSYTTVLSYMPTSPFFIKWLKDHTAEESESLLEDAGLQGSKVHHTIELMLKGDIVEPSGMTKENINGLLLHEKKLITYLRQEYTEKEDKMIRGFINFWNDYAAETIKSEFTVYSDEVKCAGTCDWVGNIKLGLDGKKEIVVVDWKTGKGVYDSHHRQVAAYFYAIKEMITKKIIKIKEPTRGFLLHLKTTKKGYDLIEVKNIEEQYSRFKNVNREWDWANPNAKPKKDYEFLNNYEIKKSKN
jgi:hypothetical protein